MDAIRRDLLAKAVELDTERQEKQPRDVRPIVWGTNAPKLAAHNGPDLVDAFDLNQGPLCGASACIFTKGWVDMPSAGRLARDIELIRQGGKEGIDLFLRSAREVLEFSGDGALQEWLTPGPSGSLGEGAKRGSNSAHINDVRTRAAD